MNHESLVHAAFSAISSYPAQIRYVASQEDSPYPITVVDCLSPSDPRTPMKAKRAMKMVRGAKEVVINLPEETTGNLARCSITSIVLPGCTEVRFHLSPNSLSLETIRRHLGWTDVRFNAGGAYFFETYSHAHRSRYKATIASVVTRMVNMMYDLKDPSQERSEPHAGVSQVSGADFEDLFPEVGEWSGSDSTDDSDNPYLT